MRLIKKERVNIHLTKYETYFGKNRSKIDGKSVSQNGLNKNAKSLIQKKPTIVSQKSFYSKSRRHFDVNPSGKSLAKIHIEPTNKWSLRKYNTPP